jgi:hypothetical protein
MRRYFVQVPAATTLSYTVAVADSANGVLVLPYDPDGRPAGGSGDSLVQVGYGRSSAVRVDIPAEDARAGVYELDVVNQGTGRVTVSVRAQLAAVALTPRPDGSVEVANGGSASVSLSALPLLAGAERRMDVAGRGAPPESLWVGVPDWATRAEVFVEMPRPQWELFTDFGVTVFDSSGEQVHSAPMNYSFGRQTFDVPGGLAGRHVLVELFPSFARADSIPSWKASVRVRFFTETPAAVGPPRPLDVVPGGRVVLPPITVQVMSLPDGFSALVLWRLSPARGDGPAALGYQEAH